ncbi:Microcystin-dependent protein [Rubritalea squalenifaciens DSM 18772]|uniref:Microcystin-dependent protein n=1 Tax=Rubritalea squalenifaciens DSM 18772 TaxID=1123071 RepID=A0A1M6JIM6_9BACT|nr:tail fiber protein [Rubritalea squalenifaciens]SHJ46549.1 Microcystin-dependent protein [Rubritalea squalenifaciens DSM 18772]
MEGYIGEIRMFAGNFAPRNWEFCNGQDLPINQYASLYSIIGTTYGGDGVNSVGLPDFRGRTNIHPGTGPGLSPRLRGNGGGVEEVYLNESQIPSHTHQATAKVTASVGVADDDGSTTEVSGHILANSPSEELYSSSTPDAQLGGVSASVEVTNGSTGGSQSHTNMMPYLTCYYIICVSGQYPERP